MKVTRPFITRQGTPCAYVTKYGTPYTLKLHAHSLRNKEPLVSIWNALCVKVTRPFIRKQGTPCASVTKHGTPYMSKSYTHSLQNMEPLVPLLLNMEPLVCQSHTPIHYKKWNPLCLCY